MTVTYASDATALSTGLLVARLVLGIAMAAHGTQKLFGWFGGYGLKGTGGFFESLGFRPGVAFAAAAATGEVASGLLVALGFLGPVGPALMVSVMLVAMITVHWKEGFFAAKNGVEVPVLYATGAVALALAGPGAFSIDALLGLDTLWRPSVQWAALGVGIAGALGALAARRRPAIAVGH